MKRSKKIQLVMIGCIAALSACDEQADRTLSQQSYSTLDECKKDWDEKDCNSGSTTGHYGGGYYGPRYYWDRNIGSPVAVDSDGSSRIVSNSRISSEFSGGGRSAVVGSVRTGGFGMSAHGVSSGGG